MIVDYSEFKNILNKKLFENGFSDLLCKIADNPDRYIGLFRPTRAKTKLIQNITQSHEIKFGDALEVLVEIYFQRIGFELLPKRIVLDNGEVLSLDQLFRKGKTIYLIEQKVRDDHDSTKKRGQFNNFEDKYYWVSKQYNDHCVIPIMWFVDPSLRKNYRYYTYEMDKMAHDYGCSPCLFYGNELFAENGGIEEFPHSIYNEILNYLKIWKEELPDMPEVNFDIDSVNNFQEIRDIKSSIFRKLLDNEDIITQIFPILFPEKKVLSLLRDHFATQGGIINQTIATKIHNACQLY